MNNYGPKFNGPPTVVVSNSYGPEPSYGQGHLVHLVRYHSELFYRLSVEDSREIGMVLCCVFRHHLNFLGFDLSSLETVLTSKSKQGWNIHTKLALLVSDPIVMFLDNNDVEWYNLK
jgi:hypothetical protein